MRRVIVLSLLCIILFTIEPLGHSENLIEYSIPGLPVKISLPDNWYYSDTKLFIRNTTERINDLQPPRVPTVC